MSRDEIVIYVPGDAAARSVGADAVAAAISAAAASAGRPVRLVRNGSRGLLWLEPLVEVATARGRIAYGPVAAADVPSLVAADLWTGGDHPLRHGPTDAIPYLARQERVTFGRIGVVDPLSLDDYRHSGGLAGLGAALGRPPAELVAEVTRSGLRGRGGAGFPTGIKWQTVLDQKAEEKYVVLNADEGDSGTFSDRLLLEGDPFLVIEGMILCGLAVGATVGYVYLRSEYPDAERTFGAALATARAAGLLGADVLGSGRRFDIMLRRGAGAYICGEETALLESLEGKRGEVRYRPPVPAQVGLFGKPTALNNVVTIASVPGIIAGGAAAYQAMGVGRSRGTLAFQLAGNVKRGGLVERAFGLTLGELIYDFGGGTASGRPVRAVQVGGPLGAYLPASALDLPLDYEAFAARGAIVGHGGVVVFDDTVDMSRMARYAMAFCAAESCGKCTPCRIGSTRGVEVIDRIRLAPEGRARARDVALLKDLCETMTHASLCALGGLTPAPVLSALEHYPEDFGLGVSPAGAPAASPGRS
jgi:formate dehydrogenase iron-sulfur subunit